MADTYSVTLPNGRTITKTIASGASDAEIRAAFAQDLKSAGLDPGQSPVRRFHENNALAAVQNVPDGYYIPGARAQRDAGGLADRFAASGYRESSNFEDRTAHPLFDMSFWLTHPNDPEARFWLQNFTAGYQDLGPPPLLSGRWGRR
jgi:hypothetical protein